MASLRDLPPEIVNHIVGFMAGGDCEGSLAAFASTCRGLYGLLMPYLYHDIVTRHPALIHWAAHFGNLATARRLIDAGAPLNSAMQWSNVPSPFRSWMDVSASKTPREVYNSMLQDARLIQDLDLNNLQTGSCRPFWYPIHLAAISGNLDLIDLFLQNGPPNLLTAKSYQLCACFPGVFLRSKPESLHASPALCLPLHIATCCGHYHVVKNFLERGSPCIASFQLSVRVGTVRIFWDDQRSCTLLHDASRLGHVDLIRFVLGKGYQTDVHELDGHQLSPIWHAYLSGNWDAVDTLVAHGADIDDDIGFGYTPLFDACLFQKYQMAAELIDRGANVNVEFSKARGGLYQPDIYWSTVQGFRPIDCCVRRHSDDFKYLGDFFSELVSDNASETWQPNGERGWGKLKEADDQRLAVVSKLLATGANYGRRQSPLNRPPPLVVAAGHHMFDIVRELVKHGASVNEADEYGVTPLAAVFAYDWGCCPFHPRLDSWPDDPESHFQSDTPWSDILCDPDLDPLEGGCSDLRACATFLIQNGADVNKADTYGNTPLCRLFTTPLLRSFLSHPLIQPLLWITPVDRRRLGPLLLQQGANPDIQINIIKVRGEEPKWRVPDTITYVDSRRWPRTPLEHAFWDCDFDAVEGFLEAGSTPDQSTILWMVQLLLESTEGESTPSIRRGFEVLKKLLPKSVPDARCLYLALRENNLDLAQQLWDLRSDLAQFSKKVRLQHAWPPAPEPGQEAVAVGELCLEAAARCGAYDILNGLLELGFIPIPTSALLTAVEKGNLKTIETLVKHGAKVHIRDDDAEYLRCWKSVDGCVNPVRLAIRQPNTPSIEVMLNCSTEPLTPWFRYFYLNEAYTTFNPAVVACLLRHPGMHLQQAGIDGGTDLSLAHLVRDVEKICAKGHQWDWNDGPGSFGPRLRMKQADEWMECLAEFADAGVDPTLRDSAGKSALDYLEEYMNYTGKNRFKNYLASRLRSAGGAVEGENLDAAACYGALKSFYIGSVEF